MFVCICRAVTVDEVHQHVDDGAFTADAIGERCGAGEGCGTCIDKLNAILGETLLAALKQAMTWQNYALANSNALDGLSSNSRLVSVRTWYDNLLTGLQVGFAVLTVACAAMYVMSAKRKEN